MGRFVITRSKKPDGSNRYCFFAEGSGAEILGESGEYKSSDSVRKAIESIRKNSQIADTDRQTNPLFEIREERKKYYYILKSRNGRSLLKGRKCSSRQAAENRISELQRMAPKAAVIMPGRG